MKIKRKNGIIKSIAIFQIMLVISLSIIIPISIKSVSAKEVANGKSVFGLIKELLSSFMPTVEAQEIELACCERTNAGAICQTTTADQCDASFKIAPQECKETSFCKISCCVKPDGNCIENSPAGLCLERGGVPSGGSCDSNLDCLKGCCILGNEYLFTTESRCSIVAMDYGISNYDFDISITSEATCVALKSADKEGCCEMSGIFLFTNKRNCDLKDGEFHENMLCSNPSLGSNCQRQANTGCVEGRDEVYWFDSCGNRENIVDSNKERSWNNGYILAKEKSCNAGSANADNKFCGNCNFLQGSVCGKADIVKPASGDYICKDMACRNTLESDGSSGQRKSGESWCIYDSETGVGQDAVGSRHWRAMCINGEQIIEPCADYRQEVCVEGSIDMNVTKFTEAVCMTNRWRECITIQERDKCLDNSGCFWYQPGNCENGNYGITECLEKGYEWVAWQGFTNNTCLPKTSPGFDISSFVNTSGFNLGRAVGDAIVCSQGSQICTIIQKKSWGKWTTKQGAECLTNEWLEAMNNRCMALGDCGASINIAVEDMRDGYNAYLGPELGEPEEGKSVEQTIREWIDSAEKLELSDSYLDKIRGIFVLPLKEHSGNSGTIGSVIRNLITGAIGGGEDEGSSYAYKLAKDSSLDVAQTGSEFFENAFGISGTWADFAAGASSYFILSTFGIDDQASLIVSVAYAFIPGVQEFVANLATKILNYLNLSTGAFGMLMTIGILWVAGWLISELIDWLFETKIRTVVFSCQNVLPPEGGDNCDLCNLDSLRPCSEYRCASLGVNCQLVNEGTAKEECISVREDDGISPRIISVDVLTAGHKVKVISDNVVRVEKERGGCLDPFTKVELEMKTDEAAQCKLDYEKTSDFNLMKFWLSGVNFYMITHPHTLLPPGATGVEGSEFKQGAENTHYIRCEDTNGNKNVNEFAISFCVNTGPDLTPPGIVKTSPFNGAFIPANTTIQHVRIYVNEPSDCKWDKTDVGYEEMRNDFACLKQFTDVQPNGFWKCETDLTGLQRGENNFYFRCKDNPFASEEKRNVNVQSYAYALVVTDELLITSVSPEGEIRLGARGEVTFNLEVETAGGINEGVAKCYYSFEDFGKKEIRFSETGSSSHTTTLKLGEGDYTFFIRCQDIAGNEVKKAQHLVINVDERPPVMIRVFTEAGSLFIITDEVSSCRYSNKKFNFADGKIMEPDNNERHSIALEGLPSLVHVRCKDEFGNEMQKVIGLSSQSS